jgi:filamentous hemagglutinin family protein
MTYLRQDRVESARGTRRSLLLGSVALGLLMPLAAAADPLATALPTGGQVTYGAASISQSGNKLTVTQTSNAATLSWQSFDIGSQSWVKFAQPSTSSVALNRVTSGLPSQIFGKLTSNGQIFLINSAGILFGAGSRVNVGGLIASTMDIADSDFQNGIYKFQRNGSTASVENDGTIRTKKPGGYIGLLAPTLVNEGTIKARLGTVVLAAGETVTLTLSGSNVSVQVDPATVATLIQNNAMIAAPDGRVILTAKAADALLGGVINNAGTIEATSLTNNGGTVTLNASDAITMSGTIDVSGATNGGIGNGGTASVVSSGSTTVTGTILAKGGASGGDGGSIETSGQILSVGSATIDASAPAGKAGTWLLDPMNLTIDSTAANTIDSALNNGTSVSLVTDGTGTSGAGNASAGNGDINVNSALSWSGGGSLSLNAYNNIDVNAPISWSGGGGLTLTANNLINIGAAIVHSGTTGAAVAFNPNATNGYNPALGTGYGTLATINGGSVVLAANDTLTIGGQAYTLIFTQAQLQAMTTNSNTVYYALANPIALTGSWTPVGSGPTISSSSFFQGTFEGLGNAISGLSISQPNGSYLGLFGQNYGVINDALLTGVSINGQNYVGALTGDNENIITNSTASGNITVTAATPFSGTNTGFTTPDLNTTFPYQLSVVGGLVGYNAGYVIGSSAGVNISCSGCTTAGFGLFQVGGLIGANQGIVTNSYATGTIGASSGAMIGGLVGYNQGGSINSSFATGAVTSSDQVGGLVGENAGSGSIFDTYATGAITSSGTVLAFTGVTATVAVSSSGNIGGLVGYNDAASNIATSYATGNVTAASTTNVGGLVGYNAGTVASSFATGNAGGASSTYVGGLVGNNLGTGTVSGSYATGAVTGNSTVTVGGLIGSNAGTVSSSYWNSTTGTSTGIGTGSSSTTGATSFTTGSGAATTAMAATKAAFTSTYVTNPLTNATNTTWATSPGGVFYLQALGIPLTWSVGNAATINYGASPVFGTAALTNVASSDSGAVTATIGLFNGSVPVTSLTNLPVGTYTEKVIGLTGASAGSYSISAIGDTVGTLVVQNSGQAVTWSFGGTSNTTTYGSVTPGTPTFSGLVSGDSSLVTPTVGVFNGSTQITNLATLAPGTYTEKVIGWTGSVTGNYTLSLSAGDTVGTLVVQAAPVTYSLSNATVAYGSTITLGTPTLAGVVAADSSAVSSTVALFNGNTQITNLTNLAPGTYTEKVIGLTGSANSNYSLASNGNTVGTLTVQGAPVTWSVSGGSSTVPYGRTVSLGTGNLSGVVAADSAAVTTTVGLFSGNTQITNLTNLAPGTYTEKVVGLTGSAAGNYSLASNGNTVGTITVQATPVTWSAANSSAVYSTTGNGSLGAATLSGVVSADSASVTPIVGLFNGNTQITNLTNLPAGTYTEKVIGLTGSAAGNYSLSNSGDTVGTLTVQADPVSWSVANSSAVYGSTVSLGAAKLSGIVSTDLGLVSPIIGLFNGNTQITTLTNLPPGTYTEKVIGLTGPDAGNYSLASTGDTVGTLQISAPTTNTPTNSGAILVSNVSQIFSPSNILPSSPYFVTSTSTNTAPALSITNSSLSTTGTSDSSSNPSSSNTGTTDTSTSNTGTTSPTNGRPTSGPALGGNSLRPNFVAESNNAIALPNQ